MKACRCALLVPLTDWGLRKYSGEQELIWGNKDCKHQWDMQKISLLHENRNFQQGTQEEVLATGHELRHTHKTSNLRAGFCSLCNAWRGAFGLEPTPELYLSHTIEILREIRRVLRKDGVVFWNIGDSYASGKGTCFNPGGGKGSFSGHGDRKDAGAYPLDRGNVSMLKASGLKPKDLCLIPFRVAIAAQEDGWWVRSVIIWSKNNPMPESVTDRPTESHEYIIMMTKSARYYWDADAVREQYTEPMNRWGGETLKRDTSKTAAYKEMQNIGYSSAFRVGRPMRPNPSGRNIRSVWEFPTQPFSDWDYDWSSADYVGSDGKPYIASEDCPLHGQYHGWQRKQKELHDGQPNLELPRIADIPNYLWLEPQPESASILDPDAGQTKPASSDEHILGNTHAHKTSEIEKAELQTPDRIEGIQTIPASSSGCSDQGRAPIATENNIQSHKTAPAPETNPSYKPSEETGDHIADKSVEPLLNEQYPDSGESKTLGDSSQDGLFSQIPDHNFDIEKQALATPNTNYKCSCKVSQGSHFAVFPEKLPEICIKAATPEVGCCSKCGAPWERVLKKKPSEFNIRVRDAKAGRATPEEGYKATQEEIDNYPGNHPDPGYRQTTGWQPTCKCNADKVPSIVLDPMMGAGTTLWVAKKLNRYAVGCDTSEEYCQLTVDRCRQQVLL